MYRGVARVQETMQSLLALVTVQSSGGQRAGMVTPPRLRCCRGQGPGKKLEPSLNRQPQVTVKVWS